MKLIELISKFPCLNADTWVRILAPDSTKVYGFRNAYFCELESDDLRVYYDVSVIGFDYSLATNILAVRIAWSQEVKS